jgi:enoyl-CoA hydratase
LYNHTVKFEKEEGIGIIILNRPKQMNALSVDLIEELSGLLDKVVKDNEIGVAILTGSEKVFCVGADIKEVSKIYTPVKARNFLAKVRSLFNKIEDLEKPVIAAVGGFALGGGCELALACDLRIAAENAKFGLPEIKLGIIPGGGGTQRLPRIIGMTKAKELLYTGDPIDAKEALLTGLVNKVVAVESLMDEGRKMASKIFRQPSFAIKMAKHAVNRGINMDVKSAIDYEARCAEMLFSTEDMKEGINAFIEKRQPTFVGR